MVDALYHISSEPGIARFDPQPDRRDKDNRMAGEMVWATDRAHLANQLLPRDCPRVTFGPYAGSSAADIVRFMHTTTAKRVIAIESAWLPQLLSETIYCYEFAPDTFTLADVHAGYYISQVPVVPRAMRAIDNILAALLAQDVEVRIMPTLWVLRDLIVESTLEFSIIRMRNAQPPLNGYMPRH